MLFLQVVRHVNLRFVLAVASVTVFSLVCNLAMAGEPPKLPPRELAQNPAATRSEAVATGDPRLLELTLVPEFESLAPFQPLYCKLAIRNRSNLAQPFPHQVRAHGVRFKVREVGFRGKVVDRPIELFRNVDTIKQGARATDYYILAKDRLPAVRRRSPSRVFDLPERYDIRALSGDIDLLEFTDLKSDEVAITVRNPMEDETIAGEILKGVKHGPPFHFTGSHDPDLVKQLRDFLAKYPKSAFADDFKLLLGWRLLELAIKRTETERIVNPELQAEAIKIWMTVDVKRTWVRRTVITEELMTILQTGIQEHLNVQEVLTQWKNHPPHDAEDAEKAAILKEWVPKIEASLRENQGPKTL
jgi:hypothetical protein